MSNGIWTKHFSVEGKVYYFNAAQNRSLWLAPQDSIVHEAINARAPTYIEIAGASSSYGKSSEILSVAPQYSSTEEYPADNYNTNAEYYQQHASYIPPTTDGPYHQQNGGHSEAQYQHQEPQYQQQEQQLLYEQQQEQMYNQYYEQQNQQQQQWEQQQQQQQQPQQQEEQQRADLVSVDDLMAHAATIKKTHFNNKRFQKNTEEIQSFGNSYAQQKKENELRAGNREEGSARSLVR